MASLLELFLTLLTLLSTALAQAESEKIWGAVVFTVPGDASLINQPPALSPLGAEQARLAGQTIRYRYIDGDGGNITGIHRIPRLAKNGTKDKMEHKLLNIMSTDEQPVVGTAMSFMQGLYPPLSGGGAGNRDILQWPAISAMTKDDYSYNWLAGADQCPNHNVARAKYTTTKPYNTTQYATYAYYESLAPYFPSLPPAYLAYTNAPTIALIAEHLYANNATFASQLSRADVAYLRSLASQHTWDNYGRYTSSTPIPVIGGRMLAGKILGQLTNNIQSSTSGAPLTLLFGPAESLMSFYSISGLAAKPEFHELSLPGSVIVFEVFSSSSGTNNDAMKSPPLLLDASKLSVRALIRNGTSASQSLQPVQLFYRQTSPPAISWPEFSKEMGRVAITSPAEWCTACGSLSIFCAGFLAGSDPSKTGKGLECPSTGMGRGCGKVSPVAAGFIGALIATVLFVLGIVLLVCCTGGVLAKWRKSRRDENAEGGRAAKTTSGKAGWFGWLKRKGKKENGKGISDLDVADETPEGKKVPKTNSWELRASPPQELAPVPLVLATTQEQDEFVISEAVSPVEEDEVVAAGQPERLRSTKDYSRRERELAAEDEAGAAGVGRQEPRTII